jgi:hypothetical protein
MNVVKENSLYSSADETMEHLLCACSSHLEYELIMSVYI